MTESRRRIDRVLQPEFIADLKTIELAELRERRDLTEDVESQVSFYRRLLHGRMDLLDFELNRRKGAEERSLLEALPEIIGRLPGDDHHRDRCRCRLRARQGLVASARQSR